LKFTISKFTSWRISQKNQQCYNWTHKSKAELYNFRNARQYIIKRYAALLHFLIGTPKKFKFHWKFWQFQLEHCSDWKIEWSVCLSAFLVHFWLCWKVPSHVYVHINHTRIVEWLCNNKYYTMIMKTIDYPVDLL
jgi:hypothetical protein